LATIHDVAARAGVSTTTVSHVLNATRHVRATTRVRVLEAIEALNYQPNRVARSLRNRRTYTLGVLLPNSANPYLAEVLLGVEAACFDHGYNVIFGNANEDPKRELAYLEVLLSKQVDGIVLISTGRFRESLEMIERYEVPVVMVDRSPDEVDTDTIISDNEGGGFLATEYLLSLGHRRIGCITGPRLLTPTNTRLEGYWQALAAAGVAPDESLIVEGDFLHEGGYSACQALMSLPHPPTAMFVCNDLMAIGALRAIHDAGLRVPDNISVIGYDGIPLGAYVVPRLTTIAQAGHETGRASIDILIERIRKPDMPLRNAVFPVTLVQRDSCASARK
jgi:LacI family transcriptional regulator